MMSRTTRSPGFVHLEHWNGRNPTAFDARAGRQALARREITAQPLPRNGLVFRCEAGTCQTARKGAAGPIAGRSQRASPTKSDTLQRSMTLRATRRANSFVELVTDRENSMLRPRGSFASSAHWGQSRERTNTLRISARRMAGNEGPGCGKSGLKVRPVPVRDNPGKENSSVHPAGFPCGVLPYRPRLSPSVEQGVRTWRQVR